MEQNGIFASAWARVALGTAIGLVGALIFIHFQLPLPWMLGAMTLTTVASIAGLPVAGPLKIRPVMFAVLGVMLGATFTPDILDRIGQWLGSLSLLVVYVAVTAAVSYPYFTRIARFDPITSFFCAMPGGMSQLVPIGAAMGGDEGKIGLVHGSRVLLVVFAIPIWFQLSGQLDNIDRSTVGVSMTNVEFSDIVVLSIAAAIGWAAAVKLRMPAAATIGPLIVSALIHVTGLTESQPPRELVNFAQLVIGATIGCRFAGVRTIEVLRILWIGTGLTVIMLGIAAVFALAVSHLLGSSVPAAILSFAPGGLPEMTLMALALGVDVAYVVAHHTARIALIGLVGPVLSWMKRRTD